MSLESAVLESSAGEKLLLLDFDGTVCLGDDPVLGYAAQVDRLLAQRNLQAPGGGVRDAVSRALDERALLVPEIRFDDSGHPVGVEREPDLDTGKAHPLSWPLQDGYQLTQLLAVQAGLSHELCGEAFREGRRVLIGRGFENSDVHTPQGLPELLAQLRGQCRVVLATNSPAEAFEPWLEHLGLTDSFDLVINSSRKPFGMPDVVARARQAARGGLAPSENVLSVGDIWLNDLEHVHEIGGQTVMIDRFGTGLGAPGCRVREADDAVVQMRHWACVSV